MARLNLLNLTFGARRHEGAPARNISPEQHGEQNANRANCPVG